MTTLYNAANVSLPNNMIALNSDAGQQLLNASPEDVNKNERMIKRFKAQVNRTYCGLASLTVIINGINVAYRVKITYLKCFCLSPQSSGVTLIKENEVANLKNVKKYLKKVDVKKNGLTLQMLAHVGMKIGFGVYEYYADNGLLGLTVQKKDEFTTIQENPDSNTFENVESFREFISGFFDRNLAQGLICNYSMDVLGYSGYGGHFSPLAAYNLKTDQILVMDVWPDTQPAWVETDLLFKAMATVDTASGIPRGLLHICELM